MDLKEVEIKREAEAQKNLDLKETKKTLDDDERSFIQMLNN